METKIKIFAFKDNAVTVVFFFLVDAFSVKQTHKSLAPLN